MRFALHILLIVAMGLTPMSDLLAACCLTAAEPIQATELLTDMADRHCHGQTSTATESSHSPAGHPQSDEAALPKADCLHASGCCGITAGPACELAAAYAPEILVGDCRGPECGLLSSPPQRLLRPPSTS